MDASELLERYAAGERDFCEVELFDSDEDFICDDEGEIQLNEPFIRKSPVNLKNADLTGINLSRANICDADLEGVILSNANLHGANLSGANLRSTDLSHADLSCANLSNVEQIEDEIDTCAPMKELPENDQAFINLSYAKLSNADLTGADLTGADLTGADLTDADLTDADLTGTDLTDADLTDADLTDADLTGADLTGADLSNVDLTNTFLGDAKLLKTILCKANLSGLDLAFMDLSNAQLIQANLTFTNLSFTNLTGADLTGADLSGANIFDTILGNQKALEELQQKKQELEELQQENQALKEQIQLFETQLNFQVEFSRGLTLGYLEVLRAQQADFIQRLKSGHLLHCETKEQHSELTVISGERLKQLRKFCWDMAEKYKRRSLVRDVFINNLKGKLGEEVVKARLGNFITEVDYEKRIGGDGKVDFTLTANPKVGIQVKTRYGNIDTIQWEISSEEVEKNSVLVCILIQEEVDDLQAEYHLNLAGFLPTNMIEVKNGKASVAANELWYGGGLRNYLQFFYFC